METEDESLAAPAGRLTSKRESVEDDIARYEKQLAIVSRARRQRMRDGVAACAIEAHRNWHLYALGADLFECDLRGQDAHALMGLWSLPLQKFLELLIEAHDAQPGVYLARLLPSIIDGHRDELHARGVAVSRQRRWVEYSADLERWRTQPMNVKQGCWRDLPMTGGQRELVRVTATLLDLPLPEGMTRGSAADWLEANGANINYKKEM